MKKILLCLIIICITGLSTHAAQGYVFTADTNRTYSGSLQVKKFPYNNYLKYYNLNTEKIDADFINLSKDEEKRFLKTLTKEEKEDYKYVKKVQKIIEKGDWNQVFSKYPNFFPAYLQSYAMNYSKGNYHEALRILNKIKNMDINNQVITSQVMNYSFGFLYFVTGQYTMALNYFKIYENSGDDFIISSIANCYYALGNYTTAINYCKKLNRPEYKDKELLYSAYKKIKNYTEANKYAFELLNENYSFENLMKVQATTPNNDIKLSYLYRARNSARDSKQIYEANKIIADLEQKKLDNSVSKLTQFVKVPKWTNFRIQIPENVDEAEISIKQDEFFKNSNMYLKRYKGQELTNAFNSLNQDLNNYVQTKQNQFYQEKQLQAQQALVEEQQRSNMLQQQMIREQQIRNYIERQHFYYTSRPYYYFHPRYYGWW